MIRKIFGIYPGEGLNTLYFVLLAITWSFGISIADTLSISLFLEKVGAQSLPLSYLISGLCMITTACLFIYLLKTISPYKILISVISFALCLYLLSSIAINSKVPTWFWFFLQTSTYVLVNGLISCFWIFLDQYHDLQEAKRIFGVYNASYFFGYMLGGMAINLTFDIIGSSGLLIIVVCMLAFSIIIANIINDKISCVEDDSIDLFFSEGKKGFLTIANTFFKSNFALILVAMSLIIQLLRTTTEFGYMETFGKLNQSIPEFLGKIKAFIAAGNIIFGLLFYRRFVRRAGLGNMILIPPLFFLMVYSEWLVSSTLIIAIMGIIAVEGVLYCLGENNVNLLMNAAPAKLKGILRVINDSFFEPLGMLLSSLFLIFLQSEHKLFGFILAAIFLIVSFIIKNSYSRSLFTTLKQNAIHFDRKINEWITKSHKKEQKEIKNDLLKFLLLDEETSLIAFESLSLLNDKTMLSYLLKSADSYSEKGKTMAMQFLLQSCFSSDSKVIEMINKWVEESTSEDLVKQSNLYLAKQGFLHPEKVIADLDNQDPVIRTAAIITLNKSIANQSLLTAGLNRTIASKEIDLLLKSSNIDEICVGLEILRETKESEERALLFLSHESIQVKREAAKTILKMVDKASCRMAYKIVEQLNYCNDNQVRSYCLEILGKIGDSSTVRDIILSSLSFRPNEKRLAEKVIMKMGLKTIPILLAITKDVHLHEICRILASKILGKLALCQLQANLQDIIEIEIKEAYFYFYYAHTIQKQYPLYDLSLLQNALLTGFQSIVDFIIHLLGTAGSIEESDLLVHTLKNKNTKAHADAVEILEKNCDMKIFRQIQPLIDEVPWEEKIETYTKTYGPYPQLTLSELLNKLQDSPSLFDKTAAAHLKAKLQMPDWKKSLREQIKTSEGPFHHYAYELLEL